MMDEARHKEITAAQRRDFYLIEEIRKAEAAVIAIARGGLSLAAGAFSTGYKNAAEYWQARMAQLTTELLYQNNGFQNVSNLAAGYEFSRDHIIKLNRTIRDEQR